MMALLHGPGLVLNDPSVLFRIGIHLRAERKTRIPIGGQIPTPSTPALHTREDGVEQARGRDQDLFSSVIN
jgi:hypothetical protein